MRDLSETYLTLGFKEIADKAKTEAGQVEKTIKGMIADGLVSASLDQRNQTVEFIETEDTAYTYQVNPDTFELI